MRVSTFKLLTIIIFIFGAGIVTAKDLVIDNKDSRLILTGEQIRENFKFHAVNTTTYWSENISLYEGPYLKDILSYTGIEADDFFSIYAYDGFSVQFDDPSILDKYNPILAVTMDGAPLNKKWGPYFIISDHSMDPPMDDNYWVWAVKGIRYYQE